MVASSVLQTTNLMIRFARNDQEISFLLPGIIAVCYITGLLAVVIQNVKFPQRGCSLQFQSFIVLGVTVTYLTSTLIALDSCLASYDSIKPRNWLVEFRDSIAVTCSQFTLMWIGPDFIPFTYPAKTLIDDTFTIFHTNSHHACIIWMGEFETPRYTRKWMHMNWHVLEWMIFAYSNAGEWWPLQRFDFIRVAILKCFILFVMKGLLQELKPNFLTPYKVQNRCMIKIWFRRRN